MKDPHRFLLVPTPKPWWIIAIVGAGVIFYGYQSTTVSIRADDLAHVLSHSPPHHPASDHRAYINLILFLQAGMGVTFIVVPVVIVLYRNNVLRRRLHRRVQSFRQRQDVRREIPPSAKTSEELFIQQLLPVHPELSSHDLKLCELLRQNHSSQEIADTLHITRASVNTARYRLRKKLALPREADLIVYLNKFT